MIEFRPHIYLHNPQDEEYIVRILVHLSQEYKIVQVNNIIEEGYVEREIQIVVKRLGGTHPDPEERIVAFTKTEDEEQILVQVIDQSTGVEKGKMTVLHEHADDKPSQFFPAP
ncbi:MAG: hypothetical protein AAF587_05745 [Bacteroidota bacterium]